MTSSFRDICLSVDRVTVYSFPDPWNFLWRACQCQYFWMAWEWLEIYKAGERCTKKLWDKNESCSYALRQQAFGGDSCNSCSMGKAMGTRDAFSFTEVGSGFLEWDIVAFSFHHLSPRSIQTPDFASEYEILVKSMNLAVRLFAVSGMLFTLDKHLALNKWPECM